MNEPAPIDPTAHLRELSPLSRTVTRGEISVEVQIYRRTDSAWSFLIVPQTGTSIHWTEDFDTDEEALRAFEADLEQDGIESYLEGAPTTCPLCRAIGL